MKIKLRKLSFLRLKSILVINNSEEDYAMLRQEGFAERLSNWVIATLFVAYKK